MSSVDEHRRQARKILLVALALLIFVWTLRLLFPSFRVITQLHTATVAAEERKESEQPIWKAAATSAAATASSKLKAKPNGKIAPDISYVNALANGSKVAVILDTQFRTPLVPLILHFSTVLGPEWPILIYTAAESATAFSTSAALSRYLDAGLIQVRTLPQTVLFTSRSAVSDFLVTRWLWDNLAPAEHILLFQSDSMICGNAARSVDDYIQYDIVGFPMQKPDENYTGGLSLRKRSTIVRILDEFEEQTGEDEEQRKELWEEEKKIENGLIFEDFWFYQRIKRIQEEEEEEEEAEGIEIEKEGGINLPTKEVSQAFSTSTIDYPHPLGVHLVHRWPDNKLDDLDDWCPEYQLCSTGKKLQGGIPVSG